MTAPTQVMETAAGHAIAPDTAEPTEKRLPTAKVDLLVRARSLRRPDSPTEDERTDTPSHTPIAVPTSERPTYLPLQKWDALILKVDEENGTFVTRLLDRSKRLTPIEAQMSLEEIQPSDRDMVRPGSVFYWNIAYRNEPNGRRVRESWTRFRRIGPPQPTLIDEAEHEADEMKRRFGWA